MSLAENKAVAQRVVDEGFNGQKLQVFDELVASDLSLFSAYSASLR